MGAPSPIATTAGTTSAVGRPTRWRGGLRHLSTVLMVTGTLVMLDALLTVTWQEPITGWLAGREQQRLERALERRPQLALRDLSPALRQGTRRRVFAALASLSARRTKIGDAFGRIRIPALDRRYAVIEGADVPRLRTGPGHYEDTPFPGQRGTVGIAGHRTTYGAPFRRLDRLRPGNRIVVTMPYGRFTYRVERTRAVFPTEVWVKRTVSYDRLIVSASHPPYSARQRLVVFARLERAQNGTLVYEPGRRSARPRPRDVKAPPGT